MLAFKLLTTLGRPNTFTLGRTASSAGSLCSIASISQLFFWRSTEFRRPSVRIGTATIAVTLILHALQIVMPRTRLVNATRIPAAIDLQPLAYLITNVHFILATRKLRVKLAPKPS